MGRTDDLRAVRDSPPRTARDLWNWTYAYTGVKLARTAVCRGHNAPWESFRDAWLDRPPVMLILGARGSGKSFQSGLNTHLTSRFHPRHGTRVLGGSLAQSEQVYNALIECVRDGVGPLGSDADTIRPRDLTKQAATYRNGSRVSILAASPTSVRGPHIPTLKLDEVDEILPEIREAAMGMCMAKHGLGASVVMTSTWHKVGGPMAQLIEAGRAGAFPVYSFCIFEVLERCTPERSGPYVGGEHLYEKCPGCPLLRWCHEDRKDDPTREPKAKLSSGHYAIDALIQKTTTVSARVFGADYLCKGPKPDGLWFKEFDRARHVTKDAEYDPRLPVHLAVDPGLRTGAVWIQVRPSRLDGSHEVSVFADYFGEDLPTGYGGHAAAILAIGLERCGGRRDFATIDPAGGQRNGHGTTARAEYERAGLRFRDAWPSYPGSVADGLVLLESLISPAAGPAGLSVHSRCLNTIAALESYRRAKRGGAWQDYPEDPQHPAEELIDSLRGGILLALPDGRKAKGEERRVHPSRLI